jgi:hypothetical protein
MKDSSLNLKSGEEKEEDKNRRVSEQKDSIDRTFRRYRDLHNME